MLFVFFSFLFCPPPLYSLLCNANEQVLFVPKVSFYEFLFSFFFPPRISLGGMVPTSASFDTNISHAIGLEIQPEFESEQTVLHPKSGPQILNALRSPMRN